MAMHVSIDVIAEMLRLGTALESTVIVRSDERPLVTAELADGPVADPSQNVLYVMSDMVARQTLLPPHVAVVCSSDEEPQPDIAGTRSAMLVYCQEGPGAAFAAIARAFMEFGAWDSRMLKAIAAGMGVEAVLQIGAERLANPIALFDSHQGLICYAGDMPREVAGTIWDDVLVKGYTPIEFFTHEEQRTIAALLQGRWPFVYTTKRTPDHENLSTVVRMNGEVVGTLGQVDVSAPFTPGQIALADIVRERVELAFSARFSGTVSKDDTSYLLRGMLDGGRVDRGLLSLHGRALGWHDDDQFVVVCGECPKDIDEAFANSGRERRIAKTLKGSITLLFDGYVVSLVPQRSVGEHALRDEIHSMEMPCVISEPFDDPAGALAAYRQCRLLLGADGAVPAGELVRFCESFESVLSSTLLGKEDVRTVCDPTVVCLVNNGWHGDLARGQELVRELYAFLLNGCNNHLTARKLFLHRNTLAYHIEQLERAFGGRFEDMSDSRRLFLVSSCLIALRHQP